MNRLANQESVMETFTSWTTAEHARLHGPGKSVMSDLEVMRRASALAFDHVDNTPVNKTLQHLDRMRQRVGSLVEAEFEADFTSRAVTDCLKLVAGQQVKRLVAIATDQDDFASKLRQPSQMATEKSVFAAYDELADDEELRTLHDELTFFTGDLQGSLAAIALRAADGSDWGLEHSEMTEAAWTGEVACVRMAICTIGYVAMNIGGFENVPLRLPANDADVGVISYPFRG